MEIQNPEVIQMPTVSGSNDDTAEGNKHKHPPTIVEVEAWLVSQLTAYLKVDPDDIDIGEPFTHYDLDSSVAVSLTAKLADWLDFELEPTLFWEYPTIEALAQYLGSEC